MGRVKDWLMTMESLAEEALEMGFTENEAVQFMTDNLDRSNPALTDTLRDVYRDVKQRII
jgi:hypothetical protein|tara:strand:+ start:641 stop:820 length:180 start_codon:yes stop_codon:yes gene_type:complete